MSSEVTYTELRANLARLWDKAEEDREPVFITRRGKEAMALIPAAELAGIMETAHLLRSPRNAERLLEALGRARQGEGDTQTLTELKLHLGFDEG